MTLRARPASKVTLMHHLGVLVDGGVIGLEGLSASKHQKAN